MTAARRTALLRLWRTTLEWRRIPADGSNSNHIIAVQMRAFTRERARNAEAAGALTHDQAVAAIRALDPDAVVAIVREAFPAVAAPGESFASATPVLDVDTDGDPLRVDVVGLHPGELAEVADVLLRLRRVGLPPVELVTHAAPQGALRAATADARPDMLVARGLMRGLDGPWLVDELRKAEAAKGLPRLPAMVVSTAPTYLRAAQQAGADYVETLPIKPDALGAALLGALARPGWPGAMAEPDWTDGNAVTQHLLACAEEWQRALDRIGDAMLPWRAAYEARAHVARRRYVDAKAALREIGLSAEPAHRSRDLGHPMAVSPAGAPAELDPGKTEAHLPGLPDDAPVVRIAFADGEDGDEPHRMFRAILERREHVRVERTSAEWGVHAIDLAFSDPRPDLMVVHQLMAWKAGDAVIREIRCREAELGWAPVPIVLWDNNPSRLEDCQDAGATLVCGEWPGTRQFVASVRSILGRAAEAGVPPAT